MNVFNNDVSHDGHRERLTNLVEKSGLDNVSNIQAVEYFLTYIFPRGDVNPLAHRLLDKYETFANIINASVNDLMSVRGINKRSAKKITLFAQLFDLYTSTSMDKHISIDDREEFLDMIEQFLRFKTAENLILFAFNSSYMLTHKRKFSYKSIDEVAMSTYDLYDFIASSKPAYLVIAHNHPGGLATPSPSDKDATLFIEKLVSNFHCQLIDSFIVGDDGILSLKQLGYVRNFHNIGGIINYLSEINDDANNKED